MRRDDNNKEEMKALIESYEEAKQAGRNIYFEEEDFISIADYFLSNEDISATAEVLDEAIVFYPFSVELLLLKSSLYLLRNNIEQCLAILDKVDSISPNNLGTILLRSEIHIHLGEYQESIDLLEEFEPQAGQNEERFFFLYFKGMAYQEMDNHAEAIKHFHDAFAFQPTETAGFDFMWDSVIALEQQREFIDYLSDITEKAPYNEEAWYYLALCYKDVGLYEKAIDAFEFSTAINTTSKALIDGADLFFEMEKYEEAQKWYLEAAPLLHHKEYIYFQVAKTYAGMNKNREAMLYYRKVVDINPDNDGAFFSLGCLYYYNRQWKKAENDLKKAILINENDAQYHYILAKVFAVQDKKELTEKAYRDALSLEPHNITYWLSFVDYFLVSQQKEKALAIFEEIKAQQLENNDLLFAEAACLFLLGRHQQAKSTLLIALDQAKGLSSVFFELAPSLQMNSEVITIIQNYE